MRFGSLFTGVGGFDLAFEQVGMTCSWQVEIDLACQRVLEHRWPQVERYPDVKQCGRDNLGSVDLICGGFPCQDLSVAGRREGLAGERSGLWFEFHRILAELGPEWVVIENVPGLLSSRGGRDFAAILRGLVELRYGVCWRILDAQYFGVPQRRRRVFIVGHLGDGRAAQVLFESESSAWDSPPSRETGQEPAGTFGGCSGSRRFRNDLDTASALQASMGHHGHSSPRGDGSDNLCICYRDDRGRGNDRAIEDVTYPLHCAKGQSEQQVIAFEPRYARNGRGAPDTVTSPLKAESGRSGKGDGATMVAYNIQHNDGGSHKRKDRPNGGMYVNETDTALTVGTTDLTAIQQVYGVRRLTPTECERLQGFRDGWGDVEGASDSSRYRQMGNAVAVPVVRWIAERIMRPAP